MRKTPLLNQLVIILIVALTTVCSASSTKLSQADTPWKIVIAPKDEPGERLVVSGTVYQADELLAKDTSLAEAAKAPFRTSAQGKLERLKEKK